MLRRHNQSGVDKHFYLGVRVGDGDLMMDSAVQLVIGNRALDRGLRSINIIIFGIKVIVVINIILIFCLWVSSYPATK